MLTEKQKKDLERGFGVHMQMFGHAFAPCKPEYLSLYTFEMSDNTVKLGISRQVGKRRYQVTNATGLDVLRVHQTEPMPKRIALNLEKRLCAAFSERNARNEFFNITFEEAVAALDALAEEIAAECEKAEQLLKDQCAYFEELKKIYADEIAADAKAARDAAAHAARSEAQQKPACVYAFEMSNASVKIGHTSNVQNRISRMPREYGLGVMREHHSPDLPRDDARRIEKTLHCKYASLKIDGEFFRANFPEVCAEIDKLSGTIEVNFYEEHEEIAALSEYDRLNLLVKLVAALEPSPLKDKLAVEVAQVLLNY